MRARAATRALVLGALAVGAVVVLTACGSDSDDTSSGKASASTTSTTAATSTSAVVVKTASVGSLGEILVDAEGKALYTLTNGGQAVECTGGCLTAWPPLLLPAGTTTATGSSGVTKLGTSPSGSDLQVTQDGLPLYRFAGDMAAGVANGEGLSSFGGTWNVVKVGGTSTDSSSTTTAGQSTSPY